MGYKCQECDEIQPKNTVQFILPKFHYFINLKGTHCKDIVSIKKVCHRCYNKKILDDVQKNKLLTINNEGKKDLKGTFFLQSGVTK